MERKELLTSPLPPARKLPAGTGGDGSSASTLLHSPVHAGGSSSASVARSPLQPQSTNTNPSIVEMTALRFDAERRKSVLDQKTRHIQRLEAENSRLAEQLDLLRHSEGDRRKASEGNLFVEIDALKRSLRTSQDECAAVTLRCSSLEQKLETSERRVSVLKHLEETNELLQRDVLGRDAELAKLKQDLHLAEKRLAEAQQASLCNVLKGKISALEEMVSERDAAVGELRGNCANLESSLQDNRANLALHMERSEELEKLLGEMRVALSGLKSDLAASERLVESQHADFTRRTEDLADARAHVEQRCSLLEDLNNELRSETRDLVRKQQEQQFTVTALQNELSVAKHELHAARHQVMCAGEDERAATERMKKIQTAASDRECQIAKQHLVEQSLRAEVEANRATLNSARSDVERSREELMELTRRCDLLSHQAAQKEGADERARQLERQLQRTLEENDSLREAVGVARRREVDVESALAKSRESLALIDRLQATVEERDAMVGALRRDKELAATELDALRRDLAVARASQTVVGIDASAAPKRYISPRTTSPRPRTLGDGRTELAFGRHMTPQHTTSPMRRGTLPIREDEDEGRLIIHHSPSSFINSSSTTTGGGGSGRGGPPRSFLASSSPRISSPTIMTATAGSRRGTTATSPIGGRGGGNASSRPLAASGRRTASGGGGFPVTIVSPDRPLPGAHRLGPRQRLG